MDCYRDDAQVNLMTMLLSQRVDYTIDYEMIKRYYDTTYQRSSQEQLVFLPIKEYEGQSIEGAIGCSNDQQAASLNAPSVICKTTSVSTGTGCVAG